MLTPRQLIAHNSHVAVSGLNVVIDAGARPVAFVAIRSSLRWSRPREFAFRRSNNFNS